MPVTTATKSQIATRVQTQLVKEAMKLAGNGGVLSKDEQTTAKLEWDNVLGRAATDLRRDGKTVRLEPWVDRATASVLEALDGVDKPGKGNGKISLSEARIAVATKGDAGARIGKAYELLTGGSVEAKGPASPELVRAASELITTEKFGLLSKASGEPNAWVASRMEAAIEKWGGDSGLTGYGKLKVGKDTVWIATGSTYENKVLKEVIGIFDKEGRVLARAQIERDNDDFSMKLLTMSVSGARGDVIATAGDAAAPTDPAWTKGLEAHLQAKYDNGDDLGVSIRKAALPASLIAQFEFMERNTPDGVGLEKIEFQGKTAYAIHDYSCVSSAAIYSEEGRKLLDFVN